MSACKDNDEETIGCLNMYVPLTANITYVDANGTNLLFGNNPTYPVENVKIYTKKGENQTPLTFKVYKEAKFISITIEKQESGTFFIELKPNLVDKITYNTKKPVNDPCTDLVLTKVQQNDVNVQYDDKSQLWALKNSSVIARGLKEAIGLAVDEDENVVYTSDLGGYIRKINLTDGSENIILQLGSTTGIALLKD